MRSRSDTMSVGVATMPKRDNGTTTLFRALSNYRRQAVILSVGRREEDIGELSTKIAKKEAALDDEQYCSKVRKRVYTSLYQSHLPKMDEWGLVEYDKGRGKIKATRKGRLCRWLIRLGGLLT